MAGKSQIESLRARKQRALAKYDATERKLNAAQAKHAEATRELEALVVELREAEDAKRAELEAQLAELTPASA